jgi:hypothetical protein
VIFPTVATPPEDHRHRRGLRWSRDKSVKLMVAENNLAERNGFPVSFFAVCFLGNYHLRSFPCRAQPIAGERSGCSR